MKRFKFLGIPEGQSFALTARRNGRNAGPITVSNTNPPPPDPEEEIPAGPVTILLDRSTLQCAPDSVRFSVDLSQAGFDTPVPDNPHMHDERLNNLLFIWDFGDSDGSQNDLWNAPVKVLEPWKRRHVGLGPFVSHLYREPGDYTVSLRIIEPESGKVAETSERVRVLSADETYPGSMTTCVNPVGDNDFSHAPPGARTRNANLIDNAFIANNAVDYLTPQRYLFKRGASYTFRAWCDHNLGAHSMFGAYGPGTDRAIANVPYTTDNYGAGIYLRGHYGGNGGEITPDFRIYDLAFTGNFDAAAVPAQQRGLSPYEGMSVLALQSDKYADHIIHNCTFEGFQRSILLFNGASNTNRIGVHLDDCTMTNFGGEYPVFFGNGNFPTSHFSTTGCCLAQSPDAMDGELSGGGSIPGGSRSVIRLNIIPRTYLAGCDFFVTDGSNHCVKVQNSPKISGGIVNVHSCSFEGGSAQLSIGANIISGGNNAISTEMNVILDGLLLIGSHASQQNIYSVVSGMTLRNSLAFCPAVKRSRGAFKGFLFIETIDIGGTPSVSVLNAPIDLYNNTFICERTSEQNNDRVPKIIEGVGGSFTNDFTNIVIDNNVLHMPNLDTPQAETTHLSSTVLFAPRNIGRRDPETLNFDASFASPADSLKAHAPELQSTALGMALSGETACLDILGEIRPEPPSKGAWENG